MLSVKKKSKSPGFPTMISLIMAVILMATISPVAADSIEITPPLIAMENYPPYHYWVDETPQGLDIEILTEVFSRIGLTPRFVRRSWKRSLNDLEHGAVTAVCSGMKTRAREEYALYPSRHLSLETNWVISLADSKLKISSLDDLVNLRVGTVAGYSYGPTFDSLPNLNIIERRDESSLVDFLINRRVQAIIGSDLVMTHAAKKLGVDHLLKYQLKLTSDPLYLMLSKAVTGNEELAAKVSNALSQMIVDGTYQQLIERYSGMLTIPTYSIVTDFWPPFRIKDSTHFITGIDKDIMEEIGKRMGIKFIWSRRPWVRCLYEIENGSADVITGIARTPEREKYTLFTTRPYYELGPALYVHDQSLAQSITQYEDLHGLSIGYTRGSVYFKRFDTDDTLDKRAGKDESQLLKMVQEKRWDALVGTDAQVDFDIMRLGLNKQIFKTRYIPRDRIKLYIGVSKKSKFAENKNDLDAILNRLIEEGFIKKAVQRHVNGQQR